ncbi:MAG: ABC transporter transmembrane domain-containing protein [Phycisphaerae bacterium]|nr:ABC transporter transmembrane domain-containing protein [Phycisphaerae bacterium]
MKAFRRLFSYIFPQWHLLVVIFLTAVMIGLMFTLSVATIIPILKVMMGQEGLHGWINRGVVNWRYGVEFSVPDTVEAAISGESSSLKSLLVIKVKSGSLADKAGLAQRDTIINVGEPNQQPASFAELIARLAESPENETAKLTVQKAGGEPQVILLDTGQEPFYARWAQQSLSLVPREGVQQNKLKAIMVVILAATLITVMRCMARFFQEYFCAKLVQRTIAKLREDVFSHTLDMPMGFFVRHGISDTISRTVGDVSGVGMGINVLLGKALREPMKAIGTLAFAMFLNYKLTLVFLCAAPVTIGFAAGLGKKIKRNTKRSLMSSASVLGKIDGIMSALGVVKVYNRQGYERSRFREINQKLLKRMLRVAKVDAATDPVMEVLGMFAAAGAIIAGAYWVFEGGMDSASFFALLFSLGISAESVRKTSDVWNRIQQSNAAAERVFEVIDQPLEIDPANTIEIEPLRNKMEFRDIYFTYPNSPEPVLRGINLKIEAGKTVAVVGPNGSGKTTLINLIPRFYEPDSGSILIDSQNIADVRLTSLRSQIGMVSQGIVTFTDTVAENIAYGKPDATMDEIIAAAKASYAHEFIDPLPDGYNTMIGENNAGFSGGQMQRIVIARAILKDPAILILDEAMSQIDADSEAKIHKALSKLMVGRTSFVIAHRFSTVINADIIVVMEQGRIVAQGTHDELIKDSPLYRSLYQTQLIGANG